MCAQLYFQIVILVRACDKQNDVDDAIGLQEHVQH